MTTNTNLTNAINSYDWMWEGAEDVLREMGAEAYITEYLNNNEWSYQFPDFEGTREELKVQVFEENLEAAIAEAQTWMTNDANETVAALAADFEMSIDEFHQAMLIGGSIADGLSKSEQRAVNIYFGRG